MPKKLCEYCNELKDARGFSKHFKACKKKHSTQSTSQIPLKKGSILDAEGYLLTEDMIKESTKEADKFNTLEKDYISMLLNQREYEVFHRESMKLGISIGEFMRQCTNFIINAKKGRR